jgi:hypothetical protein
LVNPTVTPGTPMTFTQAYEAVRGVLLRAQLTGTLA